MLGPIATGLFAAAVVTLSRLLQEALRGGSAAFPFHSWAGPVLVLAVAALAMVLQRFFLDLRPGVRGYDGLADLFIHIHSPATPDSPSRWGVRGLISFLLSLCGGAAGPEGGATELSQALSMRLRSRSSRWFEQRRRTDVAAALSGGLAAAFGAPFAATLVPIELGIGGRSISGALSALSAFLGARYLAAALSLPLPDFAGILAPLRFVDWRAWAGAAVIGVLAGAVGAASVRFIRYSQDSLLDLFRTAAWMRVLAGGVLLFLVAIVYRPGYVPSQALLEQLLWGRIAGGGIGLLFFVRLLALAVTLSGFGTVGLFWPLLAIGGLFGCGVDLWVLREIPGFAGIAALAGGAAFWGAVIGTPISGALLAWELTQNVQVLLPALIAGLVARETRRRLRTRALVDKDLEARGVPLIEGRSASVLDSVLVRDAMVTDHETVHEQEPVSGLQARLLKSRYPFLPVVSSQGIYCGLLTIDMVQEAWQTHSVTSNEPLSRLLEAKDLLYRSGFKTPTVRVTERLSVTAGLFEDIPCVPVLAEDHRVLGLLFVYNVRLAYDREVARRSLELDQQVGPTFW